MLSVKELFDEKAGSWAQKYGNAGPLAERRDRLASAVSSRIVPPAKILDFGCGTGDVAVQLHLLGYGVTGADISPAMLSIARQKAPGIDWRQLGSEVPLPFSDGSFDAVMASSVLEYVVQLGAVLAELRRIVRAQGLLFVTVPNPRHPVRWLEGLARSAVAERSPRWLAGHHRLEQFASYLRLSRNRFGLRRWVSLLSDHGFDPAPANPDTLNSLSLLIFRRR